MRPLPVLHNRAKKKGVTNEKADKQRNGQKRENRARTFRAIGRGLGWVAGGAVIGTVLSFLSPWSVATARSRYGYRRGYRRYGLASYRYRYGYRSYYHRRYRY